MAKFWPYHHPAYLMGEGVCRPNIFNKSSWRCELSYETLPITLCSLLPLLFKVVLWPNFGHSTTVNVWGRIGKKYT